MAEVDTPTRLLATSANENPWRFTSPVATWA